MIRTTQEKVLEQIFLKPTYRFHVRELAKITKLNPNTILRIIKILNKEEIIKIEKKKHLKEVYGNLESKNFIAKKRLFNLSLIYSCGIVDFLMEKYEPEAISVIGSYSRGEDIEKSDVDIVVISKKKQIINLDKYEEQLHKKIHLLVLDYKDISEEFYINLINGLLVYGYINKK